VRRAVEHVGDAEREAAGNGDADAALHAAAVRRAGLHRRAREHDQVGDLASLERQFDDALVLDDVADAGAADVDDRRGGLYGDRLFKVADRQLRVERGRLADLQHDSSLRVGPESLERDLEAVRARRHVRHDPGAFAVGDDGPGEPGIGLGGGHGNSGKHGAAFIRHAAGELTG
jgi:hypothetical protein